MTKRQMSCVLKYIQQVMSNHKTGVRRVWGEGEKKKKKKRRQYFNLFHALNSQDIHRDI